MTIGFLKAISANLVFLCVLGLQIGYAFLCVLGPLITVTRTAPQQTLKTFLAISLVLGIGLTLILWIVYFFLNQSGHSVRWLIAIPPLLLLISIVLTIAFYLWPFN